MSARFLTRGLERRGELEPAVEGVLGALVGVEASRNRLAVRRELERDPQRLLHRMDSLAGASPLRYGEAP